MHQLRLGVLGSGKGSNFRAIHEAIRTGRLDARVVVVCSDVVDSGILKLARDAGIATTWIEEKRFKTRLSKECEEDLVEGLRSAGVDLVVLAGYMRGDRPLRQARRSPAAPCILWTREWTAGRSLRKLRFRSFLVTRRRACMRAFRRRSINSTQSGLEGLRAENCHEPFSNFRP